MKQDCEFIVEDEAEVEFVNEAEFGTEPRKLKVKLDKWLWAARFFKTRALAHTAIEQGKVLYNGQFVKPSIDITIDSTVEINLASMKISVIIKGLSTRRKNATNAKDLFEEINSDDDIGNMIDHFNSTNFRSPYQHRQHSQQHQPHHQHQHLQRQQHLQQQQHALHPNDASQEGSECSKPRQIIRFLRRPLTRQQGS